MWLKSTLGLLVSYWLTVSLVLNIVNAEILSQQVSILVGFVGSFVIWGLLMTYFYSASTIKQPLLVIVPTLLISTLLNILFIKGTL